MRTVVIRVDEPADPSDTNAGFPAHLMVDDGTPDWRQRHQASAEIRRFPQTAPGATARFADIAAIHRALVDPSGEGLPYLGQLGIDLYDLLFVEPIASAWVEQLQSAGADGLRTVLDFRPSSMQALPWELMSHNHRPLFLDPDRPFVRAMRPDPTAVPVAGADDELGPIRLLVVVGDPNDNRIANEEELDGIHRGLRALHGRVHVEVAYGSSWRDFVQLINVGVRPHILHFVGHATLDPGNAAPALEIRDMTSGELWLLTAERIVTSLQWSPSLAVLNACRTADVDSRIGTWGLVQAFVDLGIRAVVAMQGSISGTAAVPFSTTLYTSLNSTNMDVAVAVAQARKAIFDSILNVRDWAYPCLMFASSPDHVVDVRSHPSPATLGPFDKVRTFVDRSLERRQLWLGVDPAWQMPAPQLRVAIVHGPPNVGKSWLVHSCLLTSFFRGRRVAYVNLRGKSSKNWLEVLRAIREALHHPPIGEPVRTAAFSQFNYELNHFVRGLEPKPAVLPPEAPSVEDERQPFEPHSEYATDFIVRIFASFRRSLSDAVGADPLILALDQFDGVFQPHIGQYLSPYLLEPILQGAVPPLRLILALQDREKDALTADVISGSQDIPIPEFKTEELTRMAREYCARLDGVAARWVPVATAFQLTRYERTWPPDLLVDIQKALGR